MNDDVVYLKHILDATAKIESYIAVGRAEFAAKSHWLCHSICAKSNPAR